MRKIFSNFVCFSESSNFTYQKKDFFLKELSCFNPLCMNMKRCSVLFCDASLSMPLIPSLSKKRRIGRSNPTPFDKNTVQHYLRGESPYLCSRSCTSYTKFDFGLIDVFPQIVAVTELVPELIWAPEFFGPQEIWSPSNLGPRKFGPWEIWSPEIWSPHLFGPREIWSPKNLVPEKFGPQEIWSPRNLVPRKFGPQEVWSPGRMVPPKICQIWKKSN